MEKFRDMPDTGMICCMISRRISIKETIITICFMLLALTAHAEDYRTQYTLSEAIDFALKHNPAVRQADRDVEIGTFNVIAARASRMPRFDFQSGVRRTRYDSPITPISGSPLEGSGFPEFDNTLYDFGIVLTLPIYRGGRLDRAVTIEKLRKSMAEDMLRMSKQELVYNLSSAYFRISQLEKLLEAGEGAVRRLEAHKKDVESLLEAGIVPKVDLLKTESELAHARQNVIVVKNDMERTYELLKMFMGIDDRDVDISIVPDNDLQYQPLSIEEYTNRAFVQRPEYKAVLKKLKIAEERLMSAKGKRFPSLNLTGEYMYTSGAHIDFNENWNLALRLSLPIFDGGVISAEVSREKVELEKLREEERSLRHAIAFEIKDSCLNIENAQKRIDVTRAVILTAEENLRIEILKYKTGAGTSTDVIDAQTVLLRARTDYYQAIFDKNIAIASLKKAIGEEIYREGH